MLNTKNTPVETTRLDMAMAGTHQVCALLIALERASSEMDKADIAAAVAGINMVAREIFTNMDQGMLEGWNDKQPEEADQEKGR